MNDSEGRGIKIPEDYTNILTENSWQRQLILHCMEKSRRDRLDFKKTILALKIDLLTFV